ncbi:MAG: polysaccharide biosynthesis protein [SAR324 cluster bacterium]|nr:polysaccharide biosynthesis protein [SAR324 cluster bacterium]
MIKGSKILITGGTGSLGQELTRQLCEHNQVVVYSRNEERQYLMKQVFKNAPVTFYIGDVRDQSTLEYALYGCDLAIHAAAMKDVIMCEDQPTQTYLNNIIGSKFFIDAVRNISSVKKAIAVSTDKAAAPSNVYGSSKYIMEKMFEEADNHSEQTFCSVRFGNMINSKGSLISIWKANPQQEIKLTHPEISRFFFTVQDAAQTVITAMEKAQGGEIWIKKMKKAKIYDILRLITKRTEFEIIGLFPGEKVHEELVSNNEARYCHEELDYYVVRPHSLNSNPIPMFSTENAESFTENELIQLLDMCS